MMVDPVLQYRSDYVLKSDAIYIDLEGAADGEKTAHAGRTSDASEASGAAVAHATANGENADRSAGLNAAAILALAGNYQDDRLLGTASDAARKSARPDLQSGPTGDLPHDAAELPGQPGEPGGSGGDSVLHDRRSRAPVTSICTRAH